MDLDKLIKTRTQKKTTEFPISEKELCDNSRSKCAKLRIAEKI